MPVIRQLLLLLAPATVLAQKPTVRIVPAQPRPGAIVRVTVSSAGTADAISGSLAGEPLHFERSGDTWTAIGGITTDAEGRVTAHVVFGGDSAAASVVLPKIVKPKAEPLAVDSSFSRPMDAETAARIDRENATAREIGRHAHETPRLWTKPFLKPRESRITSTFGSGRVFNGAVTSRHLGVDYAGAVGDPILAANRGVVALVANFFLAGKVVYIDHGGGLVTAYFHMSQPLVAKGDTVERGQKIGLVGKTGRVTGPHVHWAARYGAITVNPGDLLALPVIPSKARDLPTIPGDRRLPESR
jgi:murein DD-endopeptidase MepM/ murein hydrolase activator NlpD